MLLLKLGRRAEQAQDPGPSENLALDGEERLHDPVRGEGVPNRGEAAGAYGGLGRNALTGPGGFGLNVGVFKVFPIRLREGMRFECCGEFFSLTNTKFQQSERQPERWRERGADHRRGRREGGSVGGEGGLLV